MGLTLKPFVRVTFARNPICPCIIFFSYLFFWNIAYSRESERIFPNSFFLELWTKGILDNTLFYNRQIPTIISKWKTQIGFLTNWSLTNWRKGCSLKIYIQLSDVIPNTNFPRNMKNKVKIRKLKEFSLDNRFAPDRQMRAFSHQT